MKTKALLTNVCAIYAVVCFIIEMAVILGMFVCKVLGIEITGYSWFGTFAIVIFLMTVVEGVVLIVFSKWL